MLTSALNKMVKIHTNDEELTEFQRHMFYSPFLVDLFKNNDNILMQIFNIKLKDALQSMERKFHMLKDEVIALIKETGFQGENLDEIVEACFNEINPGEKYNGFEGIYYYEYLQVLLWISMVFIQKDEDNPDEKQQDSEVTEEVLIEKLTFLIELLKGTLENEDGEIQRE